MHSSAAEMLDLVRRITPDFYAELLRNQPNSGWEIHQGQAKAWERVSLAIEATGQDLEFLQAAGAARAVGTVQLSRPEGGPAVSIEAGARVGAGALAFILTQAVHFGLDDEGPHQASAVAERFGYSHNVAAGRIDRWLSWMGGIAPDPSIWVTNPAAFHGGRPPALDALGWERGMSRRAGESDGSYRTRLRQLADIITPNAVSRLVDAYSIQFGTAFLWAETNDVDAYVDDAIYWDDQTCAPFDDLVVHRGAIFALVPEIGEQYNAQNFFADDLFWDDGGYFDDWDQAKAQVGAGLAEALDRITAAGIAVVVLQPSRPAQAPFRYDNYTDDIEA